jgi:hypothetical protein
MEWNAAVSAEVGVAGQVLRRHSFLGLPLDRARGDNACPSSVIACGRAVAVGRRITSGLGGAAPRRKPQRDIVRDVCTGGKWLLSTSRVALSCPLK